MSVKSSELLHVGDGRVVIDRLQTGGPDAVNIPTERVYELGNYQTVGIVRDLPDLTIPMESLDVTADLEARVLLGLSEIPAAGTQLKISGYKPLDVAGLFKAGRRAVDPTLIIGSAGVPNLYLERLEYRFGLRDFARQSASFKGSSLFYAPFASTTYVQHAVGSGTAGQTVITAHPATLFTGDVSTGDRRVLAVSVDGLPLFLGPDYAETEGTVTGGAAVATVTFARAIPSGADIKVMYQSPTPVQYPQSSNNVDPTDDTDTGTTPPPLVKPSAIRGRDIKIYVGDDGTQNPANLWGSVQDASVDFRVNLERDEEFGNYQVISQDFITPECTGSVTIKPKDYTDFKKRVDSVTVTPTGETAGPYKSVPVPVDIVLHDPRDGSATKTLFIPDAVWTLPGYGGRVNTKLTSAMPFTSESGELYVIPGTR